MSVQVSPAPPPQAAQVKGWSASLWTLLIATISLLTLLLHGYHPLAEDGGLYVAGIKFILNRSLFPQFTEFVSEHLRFSVFAPLMASAVRLTHLPLSVVLLAVNLLSIGLTLAAARALLRRTGVSEPAQLSGVAMLAVLWTLPVAGTSLMLMDPYVTARSLSTPLSLWAVVFALDAWPAVRSTSLGSTRRAASRRARLGCHVSLLIATAFHPLMAGYALGLILCIRLLRTPRRIPALLTLGAVTVLGAAALQAHAPAEPPALVAASITRYYWFLSQWQWYELIGLLGPVLVLSALLLWRRSGLQQAGRLLCISAIVYGCFGVLLALLLAHQSYRAHIVARLQPLRVFLLLYLVMVPLLGAALHRIGELLTAQSRRSLKLAALACLCLLLAGVGFAMFTVQRNEFPASIHLELPWRAEANPNPWVRAFLWSHDHTPIDALFAMDARYITTDGEDAQTFRAISQRSILPDYSKDGGEAAITPALANEWAAGVAAQTNLNHLSASDIRARLTPLRVTWVILRSGSPALLTCPYDNGVLRVCRLSQ